MQQYRMLRNNKESGPYSCQDLIDMPLKAYDLIWVEGKSASWRYPSEIEELKAYAPAVQEDFYAQFHTPAKVAKATPSNNAAINKPSRKADEKRYVSVILPQSSRESGKVIGIKVDPASVKETVPVLEKSVPAAEHFSSIEISAPPTAISSETAIETSSEIETIPLISVATIASPVQVSKKPGKKETIIPTEKILVEDSSLSLPEPVSYRPNNSRYWIAATFLVILAIGIYLGTRQPSGTSPAPSENNADGNQASLVSSSSSSANEVPAEDDIPRLQPNAKLDFASLKRHISVVADHYDAGFFGGISNLSLTVKNNSPRPVQKLVIAIDYLNNDKSIHHTENITVDQLAPNGKYTVDVPDSRNGVAFQTRVIGINGLSNP